MKTLVLLVALLLAYRPGAAQLARPAAPPDSVAAAQLAAPDTVAAIHHLFAAKRRARSFVLAGTAMAVLGVAFVVASRPQEHSGGGGSFALFNSPIVSSAEQAGLAAGILGVPAVTAELVFYSNFSRRSEKQALEEFHTHQLPKFIKRKFKSKYFH